MSQDRMIKLACKVCERLNYRTPKSKLIKQRLELNKFCKFCKKTEPHKETK